MSFLGASLRHIFCPFARTTLGKTFFRPVSRTIKEISESKVPTGSWTVHDVAAFFRDNKKFFKLKDADIKKLIKEDIDSEFLLNSPFEHLKACGISVGCASKIYRYFQNKSSDAPDWTSSQSILSWIEKYRRSSDAQPSKLVESFGSDFPFRHRDATISVLWNGASGYNGVYQRFIKRTKDQICNPIPILACGPGTGKSRFLVEASRELCEMANRSAGENIRNAFQNVLAINVTYGNGTSLDDLDLKHSGEISLAMRVLYEYFISSSSSTLNELSLGQMIATGDVSKLKLRTAVQAVYADYNKCHPKRPNPILILGVDEISTLHMKAPERLKEVVDCIGRMNCQTDIFCVPIMAGTIQGPLEHMVSQSRYRILPLPLPLLDNKDMVAIAHSINFPGTTTPIPTQFLENDLLFLRCMSDIGGMARATEMLFHLFLAKALSLMPDGIPTDEVALANILKAVDMTVVMRDLKCYLRREYHGFKDHADLAMPILAAAVLDMTVDLEDVIEANGGKMEYKELAMTGIIKLEPTDDTGRFHVRVPFLWVALLIEACASKYRSLPWRHLGEFIQTNTISWGDWERFNLNYLAFRIFLLPFLQKKSVTFDELFQGADFGADFPQLSIKIPDFDDQNLRVHHLLQRYPDRENSEDIDGIPHNNLSNQYYTFFVNGTGARVDGFVRFFTPEDEPLMLSLQVKYTNEQHSNTVNSVDNDTILAEYRKFVGMCFGDLYESTN